MNIIKYVKFVLVSWHQNRTSDDNKTGHDVTNLGYSKTHGLIFQQGGRKRFSGPVEMVGFV